MDLSYDGTPFCGWQLQADCPTVQGELERALGVLLHGTVPVTGAGRTDTGVHALHYVAHFDTDEAVSDCGQLRYKLNAILPKAISIHGITPAEPDFHARFSATSRSYSYYLHRVKDPFMEGRSYFYGYPDVDFALMNRVAGELPGTHDFSCFEKTGGDNKTSVCTVTRALWVPLPTGGWIPARNGADPGLSEVKYWRFDISADRFLRNMVRAIVGTLLEVGRGRRSPEEFRALILPADIVQNEEEAPVSTRLRKGSRCDAGQSVPGHALYLTEVKY